MWWVKLTPTWRARWASVLCRTSGLNKQWMCPSRCADSSERWRKERYVITKHGLAAVVFNLSLCKYVIVHTILPPSPVILWIELGSKPKWRPLNFEYHDVMRSAPIEHARIRPGSRETSTQPSRHSGYWAGWQAKMASIKFRVPWCDVHDAHCRWYPQTYVRSSGLWFRAVKHCSRHSVCCRGCVTMFSDFCAFTARAIKGDCLRKCRGHQTWQLCQPRRQPRHLHWLQYRYAVQ